jgi:sensor histidine kinase regulating citrate/malate metabolism
LTYPDPFEQGGSPMRRWLPRTLAGKFLVLQLVVVALVLVVAAVVSARQSQAQFRTSAADRILGAAENLAANPAVRERIDAPSAASDLAPIVESARIQSGTSVVVIADADRIIIAATDPTLIGSELALPDPRAWDGRAWDGDLALAGNDLIAASTPVFTSPTGGAVDPSPVGLAFVGEEYPSAVTTLASDVPEVALLLGLASLAGLTGSFLLARRIKKQTRGLEPAEIATLTDQREALLHSIREGVVGGDPAGRVTIANDGARDLLDLPEDCVGRPVDGLGLEPDVADVLCGRAPGVDVIVVHRDRVLVANRRTARTPGREGRRGEDIGTVTTLRDRSDLIALQRQLGATRSVGETLRAQTHEFDNQLHIISGLAQLGEYEELREYLSTITARRARMDTTIRELIKDPAVAALLTAKSSLAAESRVELHLSPDSHCDRLDPELSTDVGTVLGNLVDNALDAVANSADATVTVEVVSDDSTVRVVVSDSGPGVPEDSSDLVFARGFSTKSSTVAGGRGVGLSLVRMICLRRGGWVGVRSGQDSIPAVGAVFTAVLGRAPVGGGERGARATTERGTAGTRERERA